MTRKEKGKELEKRTREFAVQIIELASELPNTQAGKIVEGQMVKAGTSIGANYELAAAIAALHVKQTDLYLRRISETRSESVSTTPA